MEERADTLTAYHDGKPIFTSNGNWLYPLFELESYLAKQTFDPREIRVVDTIIGKAAAILLCRIGIGAVEAGILSKPGERVFKSREVDYTFGELVDLIACATEEILSPIDDFEEAYEILLARANR